MPTLSTTLLAAALLGLPAVAVAQTEPVPTPTPTPTAPVTGNVIMRGDWDGRIQPRRGRLPAQWLGLQAKPRGKRLCFSVRCAAPNLRIVSNVVRDGSRAARFEVRDRDNPFGTDERVEVQGANTGRQGSIRWYTFSIQLPANFTARGANPSRYMFLTKWAIADGVPPLALSIDRGQLTLKVVDQRRRGRIVGVVNPWGVPVTSIRGRWVDIAMFVRWDTRPARGQVQLWLDGVQQQMNYPFDRGEAAPARYGGRGAYTFTGRTLVPGAGATYVKQGIARARQLSGRTVVFHDGMTVRAATTVPVPAPPPAPPAPEPVPAPVAPPA